MKTPTSMNTTHQTPTPTAPWLWPLCGATLLPAADEARWLVVSAGDVWLTRSEGAEGLSDDIWLAAGQRQRLPAGSEWVVEAWPAAQLELVLAPPLAQPLSPAGGLRRALRRGLRRGLQPFWPAHRGAGASVFA